MLRADKRQRRMVSLKISYLMLAGLAAALSVTAMAGAQTGAGAPAKPAQAPAADAQKPAAPLQLQSLGQTTKVDPFPQANPKYFTAQSPTVATVDAFLKTLWGYDSNRIWRVEAIQKTMAPNVSKVVVFVSDKTPGAKVQPTAFFVTADGKHAVGGRYGDPVWRDAVCGLAQGTDDPRRWRVARCDGKGSCCWWSSPICSVRIAKRRRARWTTL